MEINHSLLEEIALKSDSTGFYLFDELKFISNIRLFLSAFKKYHNNVVLGYSYKTNYVPYVCSLAKSEGANAEVVSYLEYSLAKKIGYNPNKIFFNGPFKEFKELERVIDEGCILNVDNIDELRRIIEIGLKFNKVVPIGIRINFEIEDNKNSRFGINPFDKEFQELIKSNSFLETISITGLHVHFSTKFRSLSSYQERTQKLVNIYKELFSNYDVKYFSVGGGFLGKIPTKYKQFFPSGTPTYEEYAEVIMSELQSIIDKNIEIVLEPGASVVADTFSYFGKVLSIKKLKDKNIVIFNGSYLNVKPMNTDSSLPFKVISSSESHKVLNNVEITGYTCMEFDRVSRIDNCYLGNNDYVRYDNVGAYTIVLKPPFIKEQVPVLAFNSENKTYKLIKRRENLDDILTTYIL